MNLNGLRDQIHANAVEKGFWDKPLSDSHCLMLVITELSEAVEADRKGKRFDKEKYEYNEMTECQGWLTSEEKFINVFNRCIKGTIEEELADAFIRLLDFAGAKCDKPVIHQSAIDDAIEEFKGYSFCENIYYIISHAMNSRRYETPIRIGITNYTLSYIQALCKTMDIDIEWHVNQKMKYNQSRERMHGKKY